MKTILSALLVSSVLVLSVGVAQGQTQYNNKVVVIPLWSEGSTWKGQWADATAYKRSDIIEYDGSSYIAVSNHTSTLANYPPSNQWELVAASGADGAPGVKGDTGDIGPKGDTGETGPQGIQGLVGAQGPIGETGMQGVKGDKGDTGDAGPQGIQGLVGAQGPIGETGMQGVKGDTGAQGIQGEVGPQGLMGVPGIPGMTGDVGPAGPAGDPGPVGPVGPSAYTASAPIVITDGAVEGDPEVITFDVASMNVASMPNIPANKLPTIDLHQPSLAVSCQIALIGIFPSRNFEPFIGQMIYTGWNFASRGWSFCDGQLLPISQYSALFSLLGTTYGGDGRTTFALPDMRGRVPVHPGNGPGLSPVRLGDKFGADTVPGY